MAAHGQLAHRDRIGSDAATVCVLSKQCAVVMQMSTAKMMRMADTEPDWASRSKSKTQNSNLGSSFLSRFAMTVHSRDETGLAASHVKEVWSTDAQF